MRFSGWAKIKTREIPHRGKNIGRRRLSFLQVTRFLSYKIFTRFHLTAHFTRHLIYQHVRKPTRYRLGETPNLLDIIITNEGSMVPLIEHDPGLGKSNHDCLLFDLKCSGYISKDSTITYITITQISKTSLPTLIGHLY